MAGYSAVQPTPLWNGLEQGTIAQRATPGAGVLFGGSVTPWVLGNPVPVLTNGNSANAPAAPTVNPRVDVLLDNNTWISGAEAAEPAWPTITAGRAWICGVMRVVGDGNVINDEDNGTQAYIIGRNYVTESIFWRRRNATASTSSGSAVDLPNSLLPCHMEKGGVYEVFSEIDASFNVGSNVVLHIEEDDVTLAPPNESYGVMGIAIFRGNAIAQTIRSHAAGNLKIQSRWLVGGNTVDISYRYTRVRVGK